MDMFQQFIQQQQQQVIADFTNQQRLMQEQLNAATMHQQLTNMPECKEAENYISDIKDSITAKPVVDTSIPTEMLEQGTPEWSYNFDRKYELTNKMVNEGLTPEEHAELDARWACS